jgi:uncharacterized protein (TIGR02271 family)
MKVRSSDGQSLGKVVSCGADSFIVEKGFFFPKDYTARYEQVADIREGEVFLSISGDELKKGFAAETGAAATDAARGPMAAGASGEARIPLVEEELIAEKRARKAGEVGVRKEVTTEQETISVPVTKEQVRVERVPASREAAPGEAAFTEESVTVPIYEEEVEVRKRPVVREEIRVSKSAEEEQLYAEEETRKEKAEIEKEGDIGYGAPGRGERKP